MNKTLNNTGRQLIQVAGIIIWISLAIYIYRLGLSLSQELRIYAFDNLCADELRHPMGGRFDLATRTVDHVDWCETYWWHPFRLSTRLLFGTLVAFLIWLSAKVLLSQTDSSYKRAGYFVIFMVTFHMILKGLLPSMEEVASQVCLHAWYYELQTKEVCIQQLGQFGDQRLFYPFITGQAW